MCVCFHSVFVLIQTYIRDTRYIYIFFFLGVAYNADTTEDSDLTTGATSYELSLGTTNSITIPIVISSDDIVEEHESLTVSLTDVGYPNDFGRTDGIFLHSESVTSVVEIMDDDTSE